MEIRSSNSNNKSSSSTISPLHPLRKSTFRFGNRNSSSNPNPIICTEEEEELRLPLLGRMRSAIKRCSKISNHKISSSRSSSHCSPSRQIATSQTTAVVCIRPRPVGATTSIRHRHSSSNSHHHKLVPPPVALSPSDKPP